jgi:hypothetical protein
MAAPEYVPSPTSLKARVYESPPWRGDSWDADRPADLTSEQPVGPQLGTPGPDAGYALKLAHEFEGKLVLTAGEAEEDAIAGCVAVAMRRAALFGRAPVIHDLTLGFTVWGFLQQVPPELVDLRKPLFAAAAMAVHYTNRLMIADLVPERVLRLTPGEVTRVLGADWRQLWVADDDSGNLTRLEAYLRGLGYY